MLQKAIKITLTLLLCIAANLFGCVSSQAVTPKQMYSQAEVCYKELRHSPHKMKYRHNWLRCIDKFQQVRRLDPSGPWAAAGFYKSGKLYQELAKRSGKKSDYQEARDIFERIVRQFPGSRYRGKAAAEVQKIDSEAKTTPTDKHVRSQKDNFNKGGMGTVDDLRFWSNPNYTRIVIDASRETSYYHHLLKKDPSINNPQRLYVDLKESRLGK